MTTDADCPWIEWTDDHTFTCTRCGSIHKVVMGIPFSKFSADLKRFLASHKTCKVMKS